MKKLLVFLTLIVTASVSSAAACQPLYQEHCLVINNVVINDTEIVDIVDSRKKLDTLSRSSVSRCWFTVNSVRDNPIITIDGSSFSFSDIFNACGEYVVPVFELKNPQMGTALNDYITKNGITGKVIAASIFPDALEKLSDNVEKWIIAEENATVEAATQCGASAVVIDASDDATVIPDELADSDVSVYVMWANNLLLNVPVGADGVICSLNYSESRYETADPTFTAEPASTAEPTFTAEPAFTAEPVSAAESADNETLPSPSASLPPLPYNLFGLEWYIAPATAVLIGVSALIAIFFRKRRK